MNLFTIIIIATINIITIMVVSKKNDSSNNIKNYNNNAHTSETLPTKSRVRTKQGPTFAHPLEVKSLWK